MVKDVAYGSLPGENLDIYPSANPRSKTLVFIHGGYWHLLDKAMFHFVAESFHAYGITTVLLNYPLAPSISMDAIVGSCRLALQWLYQNLQAYHANPDQIYVAGHSAGGHLAAMLVATDWSLNNPRIPANLLKGACFISGLFHLLPIQLSYLNTSIGMDREMALRNSPVLLAPKSNCPMIAAVGRAETAEFNDQSRDLYDSWQTKGSNIQLLSLPGLNHFSIMDAVTDPQAELHQAICGLLSIKS